MPIIKDFDENNLEHCHRAIDLFAKEITYLKEQVAVLTWKLYNSDRIMHAMIDEKTIIEDIDLF